MEFTCDIAKDLENAYIAGTASADAVMAIEEHMSSCESCRQRINQRKKDLKKPEKIFGGYRLKTDSGCMEDILIDKSLKKLSKRLKVRKAVGITLTSVMAITSAASILYDVMKKYKGNNN